MTTHPTPRRRGRPAARSGLASGETFWLPSGGALALPLAVFAAHAALFGAWVVDDAGITTAIKAKMVEDKSVDASAVKVETLNGTVMLSGFAKNALEKQTAESIAMKTKGVKAVRNNLVVQP